MELKYAERLLYQGSLFFSYPIKWIKEGQKGNDGQGDALDTLVFDMSEAYAKAFSGEET